MSNYDNIKNYTIGELAGLLQQVAVSGCMEILINDLPTKEDWIDYLKGNSMFLPFIKED